MSFVYLDDRKEIERFLRGNTGLHLYSIGDLDDFFWPYTTWLATRSEGKLDSVVLLYSGAGSHTLLAMSDDTEKMRNLLNSAEDSLPESFHAHLSPDLESFFQKNHTLESHGKYHRMMLHSKTKIASSQCAEVCPLIPDDVDELLEFYKESYPGNWFDPRMLQTGQYFCIRQNGKLVSVAGIHVFSPEYRVAALGNIATLQKYRGRGYGKLVTSALCQSLLGRVDHIGLNVKCDNSAAISCYKALGFEIAASFGEFSVRRNHEKD
ncbi:MAG: GNAT family N-acetyltransferase [Candidatus Sabulitectum sp.]|nr:GNAT family N-acetyltransferase [Candidatus Sabulitectum sp.]